MSDKIASQIEEESNRKITNRQRQFAKHYVEGTYSNAECARKAGDSRTQEQHLLEIGSPSVVLNRILTKKL